MALGGTSTDMLGPRHDIKERLEHPMARIALTGAGWCCSVDEFPTVRSIEPAYLNGLQKAWIKIVQIDAVLAAWLGDKWFPMRGAPAGLAAYIAQRFVPPDVLGRILRMSFYPNCSELVVRPETAKAPAERTVALGCLLRR